MGAAIETKVIDWSEEVEALYTQHLPHQDQAFMRRMIKLPNYKLLGVFNHGVLSCVFVVRIDEGVSGSDMSIFVGAGNVSGFDLTTYVLGTVDKMAQRLNCKNIYFNTRREGLIHKAKNCGFEYMETIMRKRVR